MKPSPLLIGLAAVLAASPSPAHSYTLEGFSWPGGALTVGYQPQGAPIDAESAIVLAIATWQMSDPALHIGYLGNRSGDVTIGWGELPAGHAAVTDTLSGAITLNIAMARMVDLPSVLIHELGHALGLGHSTDPTAVMFPSLMLGARRRTLTADDIAAIRALYPPAFTTHIPEVAR